MKFLKKTCSMSALFKLVKPTLVISVLLIFWSNPAIAYDDYTHYTNIGNIGVTITNFGVVGNGFDEDQPSCEYPLGTRTELMGRGGLWVGARKDGVRHVSTGIIDGAFSAGQAGFEFAAQLAEGVVERSTIETSPYYALNAVSQQDFVCSYYDTFSVIPGTNLEVPDHEPLEIRVDMETYAWSYSYADAFIILNYNITNIGSEPLEDLYIGFWQDTAVGNLLHSDYFGDREWDWYDDKNDYLNDLDMCYEYDDLSERSNTLDIGDLGNSQAYFGFRFLGASDPDVGSIFNMWVWNTASSQEYPQYSMPSNDLQRYDKMSFELSPPYWVTPAPDSWIMLLSAGPFEHVQPGETVNAVFAIVGGLWANLELEDTEERRENLILNANWAKKVYNGEDSNGNSQLDPGEDLDGDGEIDRFFGPEPPPSPQLKLVAEDSKVTLHWNDFPEDAIDRINRTKDFEGYRIYAVQNESGQVGRSNDVSGQVEGFTMLAQYDLVNELGYNIGMDDIYHPTVIDGDSFQYRFVDEGLLDGWPYYYGVTAYDRGDPEARLNPLASSINLNKQLIYPGKTSTDFEDGSIDDVGVYPNPYRAGASWDGPKERERLIWFTNLPEKCEIRIYTIAGELVDTIKHDSMTYSGADIDLLDRVGRGNAQFAGGEHAWDMVTQHDQAIATGLYLYSVEDDNGNVKTGKFMVVK